MRIAILTDRFPPDPGGLARATDRIAAGLFGLGHVVEVLALSAGGRPGALEREDRSGVSVFRVGALRHEQDSSAALLDLVVRRHAEAPFDVVHGFYLVRAGFLAAYAGGYLGIPSVASARGNDLDRTLLDPGRTAFVLRALDLATAVTAVSVDLGRKAAALAPDARVEVIGNGVDAETFRPVRRDPALARSLGLQGRSVVGFTGELRQKKGIVVLMEALAGLSPERRVSLLAVGGVRADDAGLFALLERKHPAVHVALVAHREARELPAYYALMDAFVHPSLRDGMPNAVLEAMACSRPVVATTAGGIPDVVRHERDGLLVAPGDASSLGAALGRVLDDRGAARALGRSGRDRVARDFSPRREAESYQSLYRRLRAAAGTASGGASGRASR
jgi:glycosyltransferase involved in cell wall biosynthesis